MVSQPNAAQAEPRLPDRVRHAIRVRHYLPNAEECYVDWAARYIRYHGMRHPRDMGGAEIVDVELVAEVAQQEPVRPTQRHALRRPTFYTMNCSDDTRECYRRRVVDFLQFHRARRGKWNHPNKLRELGVEVFLTDLAVRRYLAASSQSQALRALVFLFKSVLKSPLGMFAAVWAKRPDRVPAVGRSRRGVAGAIGVGVAVQAFGEAGHLLSFSWRDESHPASPQRPC